MVTEDINHELLAAAIEETLDTEVTVTDVEGVPYIMSEAWSLEVLFGDNILVISNLVVVEEWRRNKQHRYGSCVVQAVLDFAREYRLAVVAQQVLPDAFPFWERMDFVPSLAIPDNYVKDGHQVLLYGESYHEHELEVA